MTIISRKPQWSPEVNPEFYMRDRLAQMRAEVSWMRGIVAGLFLLLAVLGVLLWRTSTGSHLIVQHTVFDPSGHILWQGKAGEYSLEEVQILARLDEWVEWVRRRSDDKVVDEGYYERALKMATGEARTMLEGYLTQVRKQRGESMANPDRVKVLITGHTKESHQHYRLTWDEVWAPTYGRGPKTLKMQGTITIELKTQRDKWGRLQMTAKDYEKSPTGVFIAFADWGPITQADGQIWGKP